jgi:hypothetical protein
MQELAYDPIRRIELDRILVIRGQEMSRRKLASTPSPMLDRGDRERYQDPRNMRA